MGYLDNASVTVDAVLTKLGRERLSQGDLDISKFALGDDEINYGLYDTAHNLGSAYYGEAIERMPVLEAFTSDPSTLKYKLVTLPKNTQVLPVITVAQSSVTLDTGQSITITPQTRNVTGGNSANGYSFTVGNSDILRVTMSAPVMEARSTRAYGGRGSVSRRMSRRRPTRTTSSQPTGYQSSYTANGNNVRLSGLSITANTTTTLTITGNDTGGTVTIPVTINRDTSLD